MALANKSNGNGLSAAVEAMAKGQAAILYRIAGRKITRNALIKRQPSIEEQVQQSNAAIDALAASYNPPPDELLSPGIVDGRLVDLSKAVGAALCFFFPDVIKKKLADGIRSRATGDEIPSAERARELARLDEDDKRDWTEFEAGVVAAERHGVRIPRHEDLPVEVFLELDSTGTVSEAALEKIKGLDSRMNARRGEDAEFLRQRQLVEKEQGSIERTIYDLEYAPRRPAGTTEVIEGQKKILAKLGKELSDLNERYSQSNLGYKADAKILEQAKEKLRKLGIGVKSGQVSLTT